MGNTNIWGTKNKGNKQCDEQIIQRKNTRNKQYGELIWGHTRWGN